MGTFASTIKAKLDLIIALCKLISPSSREISLAITDAQRAYNWLGRFETKIGDSVTNAKHSTTIPTDITRTELIGQIMVIQQEILDHVEIYLNEGGNAERQLYLATNCVEESLMWMQAALLAPVKEVMKAPVSPEPAISATAPINSEPLPDKQPGTIATMNFPAAMVHCLKGGNISRMQWNTSIVYVFVTGRETQVPFLSRSLPGGRYVPWQPDQMDIFASDWIATK